MTVSDGTLPEGNRPEAPAPGLKRAGARLPVDEYTQRLWERRYFVTAYSSASNAVGYEGNFLGQAWQVLTPLLNIGVYYLIFGLLLNTNRGVPNYIAFLAVGVFVFTFCTSALTTGARAITGNLGLVRALQFPRAVLPVSTTLVALIRLIYSLIVLIPIVLVSGAPLTWRWLELVPAIGMQALFCLGLSFAAARLGAKVPDMAEILPFVARMWMYTSGVMYSVNVFTRGHPGWVSNVMTLNPGYVYLTLARHALLPANPATNTTWLVGAAWAIGTSVMSYLYFWRGEEEYGNV
jgi:teichoic acid transport system permease protein